MRLRKYYMLTARPVKALESIARSPVYRCVCAANIVLNYVFLFPHRHSLSLTLISSHFHPMQPAHGGALRPPRHSRIRAPGPSIAPIRSRGGRQHARILRLYRHESLARHTPRRHLHLVSSRYDVRVRGSTQLPDAAHTGSDWAVPVAARVAYGDVPVGSAAKVRHGSGHARVFVPMRALAMIMTL